MSERSRIEPDFHEAPPLALTMGEPAGIGGEITLKAWLRRRESVPAFAVVADPERLTLIGRQLGVEVPVRTIVRIADATAAFATALPVLAVKLPAPSIPGRPSAATAPAVIASIETAAKLTMRGEAAALVTNPIQKKPLYDSGFAHPGHTEFLGALAGGTGQPVMMLVGGDLRVVPVTIHIPIADVPRALSRAAVVHAATVTESALRRDFGIAAPRLAVAGLNPHAGESGGLGREDRDIVEPAIAELRANGLDVRGPLAADAMFHEAARRTYDAAICMYHDQALIPLKTIAFERGVNVTLGLPFIRTSPDHGTALDIAGQGKASAESLIAALRLAAAMAAQRRRG